LTKNVIRLRRRAAYRVEDIADDSELTVVRRINDWIIKRRQTIAIMVVGRYGSNTVRCPSTSHYLACNA
jgi:hypothetical protein